LVTVLVSVAVRANGVGVGVATTTAGVGVGAGASVAEEQAANICAEASMSPPAIAFFIIFLLNETCAERTRVFDSAGRI
jgi:hypothetical protein